MLAASPHPMHSQLHYAGPVHDHRPPKRPRDAPDPDDDAPPYAAPAPTASASHPDPDSDGTAKKTRKRPLSCGECRRLKLKCDRIFPCQSCVKRGCAEICPEGALTGGKGSRFILANTEQLHEKIKAMSERIRQLEEGLQDLQAQHSTETHPLLRQELLHIKRSPELFGIDRNGTSATGDHSRREEDDHPSVASSVHQEVVDDTSRYGYAARYPGIPDDLARLSSAFPIPASISSELNPHLRQRIRDMLPEKAEAYRVCEQARLNAFWHYNPDRSPSIIPNLLHSVYTTPLSELTPQRLSLFLMILAIGSMVDLHDEQHRQESEKYHHLARAALCEVAVIDEPSFDTVNSLFYMMWYLLMFSHHKKAVEHAWGIMGVITKLALSLGLHRDAQRTKMIPEELDKRKTLFWNLLNVDVRLALMLRRPPSLYTRYMDTKQPVYNLDSDSSSNITAHYQAWRDTFLAQCMIPVMDMSICVTPAPAEYSDILGLDWKVRDFNIPPNLCMVDNDGLAPNHPVGMQQALTLITREVAILNLHRNCFMQALNASEGFTAKHKYAPSVYAVYSSARNLIWATHTLHKWEPDLILRLSWIWQNAFSSATALCMLIGCAPACPLASRALAELDRVLALFLEVRDRCPGSAKVIPVMEDTFSRARSTYDRWRSGHTGCIADEDGLCQIARRNGLLVPADAAHTVADANADPLENAHPALRRCAEQAGAEAPRSPRTDLPGPRASLFSVVQTYNTSAERTGGGHDHELTDAAASSAAFGRGMAWIGAEFQDSSWMTWF